ncbi:MULTISPECIES: DUF3082 domain-containing protein [Trichocoleus]|uniref:DUF3082 domain-containing protein n=1 Tax=Trichocoleus desertorum GB2-A4 TaxID=2933944 RepID=A0ABV0J849_9CYAN|nr:MULTISPECIES: DUF3082 domain-containing protein [unclassified Trichocoleus]MBD1862308.1 DUF3082 domain-containing protein [Trichocoleus sp. FACHB-46]MBD2094766.1 DUF3082 domain-containing protein [Trichocoleus sp. FACHB-591]MBD2123563.1 DUF3082 domain-containing protein [Trichocoleus sp. FACHB-262]
MANLTPPPKSNSASEAQALPGPFRCLSGALISGSLAFAGYKLTMSIATTFAAKPIHSDNATVLNIASAVRTLVVGVVALGAGVFGFAALGLLALGVQVAIQRFSQPHPPADPS